MVQFLLKGLLRDKSHSLFPVLTITIGVAITVVLTCWMNGVAGDMIANTAKFQTGHGKVATNDYIENMDTLPIEFSLINASYVQQNLQNRFPNYEWMQRINFGGIIDVPDENGETKEQTFFAGKGLDLIQDSREKDLLSIEQSLQQGRMPNASVEILMSHELFLKLNLNLNDAVTLISTSMDGGMVMQNFVVCGTILFGVEAIDRQMILADISGVQELLYMDNCASEIVGFHKDLFFRENEVEKMKQLSSEIFNNDKIRMISLKDQQGLGDYINIVNQMSGIFMTFFIIIMSIVLWNSGLMKSIRKYGEFGVRLAIGESKGHLFKSLLLESLIIGVIGTILGTVLGLLAALYLQNVGISLGDVVKNGTILLSSTVHAKITMKAYFIGFIPGVFASLAGAALAGRQIYKRQTSQLFKELEQ